MHFLAAAYTIPQSLGFHERCVKSLILYETLPTVASRIRVLSGVSQVLVGRNEQTPNLPELRSLRCDYFREHVINGENCICAVPATLCDLVPAYCEKCGLSTASAFLVPHILTANHVDDFFAHIGRLVGNSFE